MDRRTFINAMAIGEAPGRTGDYHRGGPYLAWAAGRQSASFCAHPESDGRSFRALCNFGHMEPVIRAAI
jgi:hypothetical protein